MDERSIKQSIIHDLSRSRDPNDLITELCEQTGRDWNEVESLVEQVKEQDADSITRHQSPLLVILALLTFISGIFLIIFGIDSLLTALQAYIGIGSSQNVIDILLSLSAMTYLAISGTGIGLGMVLGSLLGMRSVWMAILKI